ncbi:MAG: type II toxin-antitoxin system VapC family toxin [Desulfobacteraceae bacterium]|jgi:PIN domain nuclease of toxin-antitoxin system|nr:type II toxin-antitoxin system VapC family toxin [Desulfobacteraceae bacterium]
MKLLLDTCCIIWSISKPEAISQTAKALLTADDSEIHVSVISVAEIACAVERGRIIIDRHWKKWFRHYIDLNDWQVDSIDLDIMEEAYSLPESFHADPADRIITATTRLKNYSLLTADRKILSYPHVNAIW